MTWPRGLARLVPYRVLPIALTITLLISSLELSGPERLAMARYIKDSLSTGTSPRGAGFFFVSKKDKTLRPCIDYRGLNLIIKNKYLLPLLNSAFDPLHQATIFTKLDLRNERRG